MSHDENMGILDQRLHKETSTGDAQFGFIPGRSTTEAIAVHRLWRIRGRRGEDFKWCS
jgi:retron-type reverse transcriptase